MTTTKSLAKPQAASSSAIMGRYLKPSGGWPAGRAAQGERSPACPPPSPKVQREPLGKLNQLGRHLFCGLVLTGSSTSDSTASESPEPQAASAASIPAGQPRVGHQRPPVSERCLTLTGRRPASPARSHKTGTGEPQKQQQLVKMIAEKNSTAGSVEVSLSLAAEPLARSEPSEMLILLGSVQCASMDSSNAPALVSHLSQEQEDGRKTSPGNLPTAAGQRAAKSSPSRTGQATAADKQVELMIKLLEQTHQAGGQSAGSAMMASRRLDSLGAEASDLFWLEESWKCFVNLGGSNRNSESSLASLAGQSSSGGILAEPDSSLALELASQFEEEQQQQQQHQRLKIQQDAIWELLSTELFYIKRLAVVIDLFLATLLTLQRHSFLLEVSAPLGSH